jgi:hypothetical protein
MFNLSLVFQKNENKQSSPTTTTNPNTTQPTAAEKANVTMSQFLNSLITQQLLKHPRLAKRVSDLLSKPHTQQAVTDNTSRVFNPTIQNKNTSNEAQTAPSSANQDQEVADTLNAVLNQVDEQNKSEQAEQAEVSKLLNELVGQVAQTSADDRESEIIPLESEVEPTAFDYNLANAPDELFDSPPSNRIEEEVVNSHEASAAGAALPPIQEDVEIVGENTQPQQPVSQSQPQPQQLVSQSQPQPKNISQQLQFGSSTLVTLNPPPKSFGDFAARMTRVDTQIRTNFPVAQAFQSKPKQTFFDMFKAFFSCLLCLFCFRRDDAARHEGF